MHVGLYLCRLAMNPVNYPPGLPFVSPPRVGTMHSGLTSLEYITSIAQLYFAIPRIHRCSSYITRSSRFLTPAPCTIHTQCPYIVPCLSKSLITHTSVISTPYYSPFISLAARAPTTVPICYIVLRTLHTCTAYQPLQSRHLLPPFLGPVICLIVYRAHYLFVILYLFCNLRVV